MIKKAGKFYYRLKGYYPVRIGERRFRGDPYHIGFWRIVNRGGFEQPFFNLLDRYLNPDQVYCDIGSWIGPTVIYAAQLCKHVYCFEPDEIAYPFLLSNLKMNEIGNVSPHAIAIGAADADIQMASHGGRIGDSMTSMVNLPETDDIITVRSVKWDTWHEQSGSPAIDFIKMDIEGGEVEVIPDMIDYLKEEKPFLHLSVHGRYLRASDRKEKLERMFSLLGIYENCYDEKMNRVSMDDQLINKAMDSFLSFLFIP